MKIVQPILKKSSTYSVQHQQNGLLFTFGNNPKDIRIISRVLMAVLIGLTIFINYRYRIELGLLILWSVLCVLIFFWLWIINIKEIIEVNRSGINVTSIDLFGRTRINQFLAKDIHNLRVFQNMRYISSYVRHPKPASGRTTIIGPLGFQYGADIYFYGCGILGEEAEEVLTLIREKFPNYTMP